MSFAVAYPGGFAFGERLPSAWANAVDADHADAIDGVGGGEYNPSNPIVIGGAGLQLNSALVINDDLTIGNADTDTLTVEATAGFNGPVVIQNLTAAALVVTGNSQLGNNVGGDTCTIVAELTIENDCTIGSSGSDTLEINSSVQFNGPINFGDELVITGTVAMQNDVTIGTNASDMLDIIGRVRIARPVEYQNSGSGIGRVPYRTPVLLDGAGETVGIVDGEVFQIPTDATGDYTLATTSAGNGDRAIFFSTGNLDTNVTINAGAGTATLSSGNTWSVEYIYFSGGWKILRMIDMTP